MSEDGIREAATRFIDAYQRHDLGALGALFSHSPAVEVVGTHEGIRLTGWEAVEKSLVQQFTDIETTQVSVRSHSAHAFAGGAAACTVLLVDYSAVISGALVRLDGVRITLAWERDIGGWRIVQMHWSLPRPGHLIE